MTALLLGSLLLQRPCIISAHGYDVDFYYQGKWAIYGRIEALNQVAIVKPIRRTFPVRRKYEDLAEKGEMSYAEDEVQVVDSEPKLPTRITIVTPCYEGYRLYPLIRGRRYLLLSYSMHSEGLLAPGVSNLSRYENDDERVKRDYFISVERKSQSELLGLAVFETTKESLPKLKPLAREGAIRAIIECIRGSPNGNVGRVCSYLNVLRLGGLSLDERDFISQRLEEVAKSLSPSNQARVYGLLAAWEAPNSWNLLLDALEESVGDPGLFMSGEDAALPEAMLFTEHSPNASQELIGRTQDRIVDVGIRTRSLGVRYFIFNGCPQIRGIRRQRDVLRLSLSQGENLMSRMLNDLACANDDREHVPKWGLEARHRVWMNKAGLVHYWCVKLGVKVPP
jgi:hypothetical protein